MTPRRRTIRCRPNAIAKVLSMTELAAITAAHQRDEDEESGAVGPRKVKRMKRYRLAVIGVSMIVLPLFFCGVSSRAQHQSKSQDRARPEANWTRFRGPNGSGISTGNVVLEWDAKKNMKWKADLPGRGASSPIIWEDRVYVTAYTGYGLAPEDPPSERRKLERHLLCFRRTDGTLLWKATHGGENREHGITGFLALHGYASSTPTADASGVYVYYGGGGVIAYSHDGKERWQKDVGNKAHSWGSASSPILFEDLLIVHADIESQTLYAFDKRTGKDAWRMATGDPKFGDSWSTPLVVSIGGTPELVFHRSQGEPATLGAVDPRSGKALWECGVLKNYLVPSPIAHDGVIYAIAHERGASIRAGGGGDITKSHVPWTINMGSEVCTPLFHDGHLYWTSEEGGFAYCLDAGTGKMVYKERLDPAPGRIYASGVLANGRIYYVSREMGTYVVAAQPKYSLLARNMIEPDRSIFNGTPAISKGQMFLRSDRHLYCIGSE